MTEDDITYECEKPGEYECEYCGNVFKWKASLNEHTLTQHQDELDSECPTCEKCFETEPGMKKHHAVVHDESLVEEKVGFDCPWDECKREFGNEKAVKIHHKKVHDVSISDHIYNCQQCGDEFIERKGNDGKYCSDKCYYLSERDRITKDCEYCGGPITRKKSRMQSERVFCDRDCLKEYIDENGVLKEIDYSEVGDYRAWRGRNWKEQREKALVRDGGACQNPNCENEVGDVWGGNKILVHHITDYHDFDNYKQANELDNLITVCTSCHNKIHFADAEVFAGEVVVQ